MSHEQKTQRGLILSSAQRAHALTAAEPALMTTYVFSGDGLFRLASPHRDFERDM